MAKFIWVRWGRLWLIRFVWGVESLTASRLIANDKWQHMTKPEDTRRCLTLPYDTWQHMMIPDDKRRYVMILDDTWWYLMIQDTALRYKTTLKNSHKSLSFTVVPRTEMMNRPPCKKKVKKKFKKIKLKKSYTRATSLHLADAWLVHCIGLLERFTTAVLPFCYKLEGMFGGDTHFKYWL